MKWCRLVSATTTRSCRLASITTDAFVDPASGSGTDSFTAAVAHRHGDQVVIDAVREIKPPFSPQAAISELAAFAKSYRVDKVVGDHYGGEFPRELFSKSGLSYELSKQYKSDLYRELLPLLNSKNIVLPEARQAFQPDRRSRAQGRTWRPRQHRSPHRCP